MEALEARAGFRAPHLVLQQELVPADEDLPQPFQNVGPVHHLLAGQPAADQEEDLRTGRKGFKKTKTLQRGTFTSSSAYLMSQKVSMGRSGFHSSMVSGWCRTNRAWKRSREDAIVLQLSRKSCSPRTGAFQKLKKCFSIQTSAGGMSVSNDQGGRTIFPQWSLGKGTIHHKKTNF